MGGHSKRLLVIAAVVAVLAGLFGLAGAQAKLPGSDFEGDDGNKTVDTLDGLDWDNVPGVVFQADDTSGQSDNSLKGDEGSTVPAVTAGSIQDKADIHNFRIARQSVGGKDFLYLAFERTPDTGDVNLDFELNQASQGTVPDPTTSGAPWPLQRTKGDILFTFDFSNGGVKPTLSMLTWQTDAGSTCGAPSWTVPCWGEPTVLNPTTTPAAEAGVGTTQDGNKTLIWFGEAAINLQGAGIFKSGECTSFGSAYVKSRSSTSPSATLSDFIKPHEVSVNNCGDLTVVKNTGPLTTDNGTFTFDVDCTGATFDRTNESITTTGGTGSFTIPNIPNGTSCSVSEDTATGWTLTSTSPDPATVTIDGNKTITFNNSRNKGKIVINKTAVGGNGSFSFTVTCAGVPGYPRTLTVTTTNGSGSNETPSDIPTGTDCTVTEAAAVGWSPSGQSQNIAVSGATQSLSFTNTRDMGSVKVVKNASPIDGTFTFTVDCTGVAGYPKTLTVTTSGGTGFDTTGTADIPTNTSCTITETAQTGTWTNTGAASQTITVTTVDQTVTFNNTRDMGAITVNKTATGGDDTFTFTVACSGVTGYPRTLTVVTSNGVGSASTPQDIPTGTSCTVTETAQPGVWTITSAANQNVTVNAASVPVSFANQRNTGKIVVNKTATGGDGTFVFNVSCPGIAGYDPTPVQLQITTSGGSGSAETASNIPTGTSCTVTEVAQPGVWTVQGTAARTVTVNGPSVSVSYTNDRDKGAITVTKQTTGGDGTFTFTVDCPSVAGYPRTLTVTTANGTGSATTPKDIPTGTTCTVTEAAQTGTWTVVGNAQQTVLVDAASENVVYSNRRDVGTLAVVVKTEGGNGTFPYTVDCDGTVFDAAGNITTTGGTGSAPVIISIPTGTTCVVTQTAQPGWTLTSASPQTAVIKGDETVTFVNKRNVNGISIDKSAGVPSATEGESVTYTYVVKATGPDALASVTVSDDKCAPVTYVSGDADGDKLLDPTESWTYTCSNAASEATRTNVGTATGVDPAGAKVAANDTVTIAIVAGVVIARAPELPRTGIDVADWLKLSGSLVLLGLSLLFVARRRRTT